MGENIDYVYTPIIIPLFKNVGQLEHQKFAGENNVPGDALIITTSKAKENPGMRRPENERYLIQMVADGDRKAFTLLYKCYIPNLYRYIYLYCRSKEISEDIVQLVFIRIWENRADLHDINSFKGYLYRMAKNLLLDQIKKQQNEQRAFLSNELVSEFSGESSDAKIIYLQSYRILEEAISLLPEKRRQIVTLRTKDELSLDEIAAKLCISKSVVKKQFYAGINFVRKYISNHGGVTAELFLFVLLLFR